MNFNKKVAFYTLGCKVNQYETESLKNQLVKFGYEAVDFENKADVYIINSCTVTSIADRKTRNMMRRVKKINSNAILILTGCYAQTDSKELLHIEEIDYIIGNTDKNGIVNFLKDIEDKKQDRILNGNIFDTVEYEEYEFATLREMSRAYIKIQDGCNSFCSYCKIPYARGKSRSRKIENILSEIKKIVSEGFKEIILIGINIGIYGEDFEKKIRIEELISEILNINGLERVRLGSVYPDKISEKFIKLFENKKMMPHLHISLQSCDDTILKMMKRNYNTDLIKEKLFEIRNRVENLEFSADIIVGFPGETDEMAKNSYNLIKEIGFADLHVFQYSDREGTVASKLSGKIDAKIKKKRAENLDALRIEMSEETREKYIGKNLNFLVEELKDGNSLGHSDNYLKIKIEKSDLIIGKVYKVKIINRDKEVLIGEEIK